MNSIVLPWQIMEQTDW